jgi:hypothetical protein
MATIIFSGVVLTETLRVVDMGVGTSPRIIVEMQQQPDAMGSRGWSSRDSISQRTLEALLLAAHVIT